jgi:hypothetical protein
MRQLGNLRPGRVGPYILLWLIGIPLPIVLLIYLVRGCG